MNRRNSDLVDKSDGVLYTSDGRDVEMSVASTKAFYAQVAAGFLLAVALVDELGCADPHRGPRAARRPAPAARGHGQVLGQRQDIGAAAARLAPPRRYWAVVGNGPNRIAASEVRIKLSELCYKSIACDATEDKKHIDLSSEPLVIVCAAGLSGPNAGDVAKEVAIYRAHKAAPVVIASEGDGVGSRPPCSTIEVPAVDPALAFVLSAMAGHLFSYEAALAIDAQALPLREARGRGRGGRVPIDGHPGGRGRDPRRPVARPPGSRAGRRGRASTRACAPGPTTAISRPRRGAVSSLLRYAPGLLPVEGYEQEYGKVGTPGAMVADLVAALTTAIEQLTRPVDAIKHQAKTVTVGISRSEEALFGVRLVTEVLAAGAAQDNLSYRALRTLAELDPAVAAVVGFTRYRIGGDIGGPAATIGVVDRGGIGLRLTSPDRPNPAAGHQAPGGRGARGHGGQGPQRRPHRDPGARDQGR